MSSGIHNSHLFAFILAAPHPFPFLSMQLRSGTLVPSPVIHYDVDLMENALALEHCRRRNWRNRKKRMVNVIKTVHRQFPDVESAVLHQLYRQLLQRVRNF
jgi:hypothetical protein